MKLLTMELRDQLPTSHDVDHLSHAEIQVPMKLFSPYTAATWYIYAADPIIDEGEEVDVHLWGYCDLFGDITCAELGPVSLRELQEATVFNGVPAVERDKFWEPKTLEEVIELHKKRIGAR